MNVTEHKPASLACLRAYRSCSALDVQSVLKNQVCQPSLRGTPAQSARDLVFDVGLDEALGASCQTRGAGLATIDARFDLVFRIAVILITILVLLDQLDRGHEAREVVSLGALVLR
eukprot:38019-Rhodomonas_salina.5